jgi:hypothetical protein
MLASWPRRSASLRAFTPIFDRLGTRVNALISRPPTSSFRAIRDVDATATQACPSCARLKRRKLGKPDSWNLSSIGGTGLANASETHVLHGARADSGGPASPAPNCATQSSVGERRAGRFSFRKKSPLRGPQIRAARALLNWSAEDLSCQSAVSLRTIRRAERTESHTSMTAVNDLAIRRALEAAGVEFINENGGGPGVRLQQRQKGHKR